MQAVEIFGISNLRPLGRFHQEAAQRAGVLPLFWAGSGLELRFTGRTLCLVLEVDFDWAEPWIAVDVNGAPLIRMPLNRGVNDVYVFRNLEDGRCKRIRLYKETQPMENDSRHRIWVRAVRWEGGEFLPLTKPPLRLEFVGDSLTSGEGLTGAREETAWIPAFFSASRTWACQTAELLNAESRLISQSGWGLRSGWDNDPRHAMPDWYEAVCGPAQGEADQALGSQEQTDFSVWQPDAVLINLGTNDAHAMEISAWHGPDGARFKQEATVEGLRLVEDAAVRFLEQLRRDHPWAKLVWTYGMAGDWLRPQLEGAVARFREETGDEDIYYLPLPAAKAETMGSRQHPGFACHQEAAEAVAAFLRDILSV